MSITNGAAITPRFVDRLGRPVTIGDTVYLIHEETVRTLRVDFLAVSESYPSQNVLVSDGVIWPLSYCYTDLIKALIECQVSIDNFIAWHKNQLNHLAAKRLKVDAELAQHLPPPTVVVDPTAPFPAG